jgi:hypothetical protein
VIVRLWNALARHFQIRIFVRSAFIFTAMRPFFIPFRIQIRAISTAGNATRAHMLTTFRLESDRDGTGSLGLTDDQEIRWQEFEAIGEEQVRKDLGAEIYGDAKKRLANQWLEYRLSIDSAVEDLGASQ